jgi:hypothetical protein
MSGGSASMEGIEEGMEEVVVEDEEEGGRSSHDHGTEAVSPPPFCRSPHFALPVVAILISSRCAGSWDGRWRRHGRYVWDPTVVLGGVRRFLED